MDANPALWADIAADLDADPKRAIANVAVALVAVTGAAASVEAFCRDFGILPAGEPPRFAAQEAGPAGGDSV